MHPLAQPRDKPGVGAGLQTQGGPPLTPCSLDLCRWEEELAKRMNLQTMVDTLQEVRALGAPPGRGGRIVRRPRLPRTTLENVAQHRPCSVATSAASVSPPRRKGVPSTSSA